MKYVKQQMAENRGYSKVFIDFIKMINGQFSDTFDAKEWGGINSEGSMNKSSRFWGAFSHYDILDILPMMEELFKLFFEDMKCEYDAPDHDMPGEELLDDYGKGDPLQSDDEIIDPLLDKVHVKSKPVDAQ